MSQPLSHPADAEGAARDFLAGLMWSMAGGLAERPPPADENPFFERNVAFMMRRLAEQWQQQATPAHHQQPPVSGLSRSQLDRLTSRRRIAECDLQADVGQCTICLSGYEPGEEVRTLPCWHFYHRECVDRWLRRQRTCPNCKSDVTALVNEAVVLSMPELQRWRRTQTESSAQPHRPPSATASSSSSGAPPNLLPFALPTLPTDQSPSSGFGALRPSFVFSVAPYSPRVTVITAPPSLAARQALLHPSWAPPARPDPTPSPARIITFGAPVSDRAATAHTGGLSFIPPAFAGLPSSPTSSSPMSLQPQDDDMMDLD